MAYELKRSCGRCCNVWYAPEGLQRRKQAKAVGWATPVFGKKRQQIRAEQALVDSQNAQVDALGRCPSCGSASFSEERVPI